MDIFRFQMLDSSFQRAIEVPPLVAKADGKAFNGYEDERILPFSQKQDKVCSAAGYYDKKCVRSASRHVVHQAAIRHDAS